MGCLFIWKCISILNLIILIIRLENDFEWSHPIVYILSYLIYIEFSQHNNKTK